MNEELIDKKVVLDILRNNGVNKVGVFNAIVSLPNRADGWVGVETPPTDSFWKRVLVNGKHHIQPHNFEDGKWYEYGQAWPTNLNITHWQDFTDLVQPSNDK